MRLFLLLFVGIYGAFHLYLLRKIQLAAGSARWILIPAALWCALMVAAPILVVMLERRALLGPAKILAWVGHTWIALIFWFCALGLVLEAWNLGVRIAAMAKPAAADWMLRPRPVLATLSGIVLALGVWAVFEAWNVRLVEVRLPTSRLPSGSEPIRIAQITDLHLSFTVGQRRLRRVVEIIRSADPDILVSTGDFTDLSLENSKGLAELLAEVETPLGKFAVMGNHEFYRGLENSRAFHETAGFRVLREDSVLVGGRLRMAGVDDPAGIRTGDDCYTNEDAALPKAADREYTVLLKHQPRVTQKSVGRFDLQLSGHIHGGQLFPFQWVVRLRYPFGPGLHQLGEGSALYVSRGTGTWGPPMRLFAPPEVTLVILEPRSP